MPFSGSLTPRIVWSIIIEVIVFMVTVAFAMIHSADWPGVFFWATMSSVVVLNSAFLFNLVVIQSTRFQFT